MDSESRDGSPERSHEESERGALSVILSSQSQSHEPSTEALVLSPTPMSAEESMSTRPLDFPPPPKKTSSTGSVAERVQAYERRMSQVDSPIKSPPPVPSRTRRGASMYGLAPKPSLFVANPDRKRGSDSS
ncbi:hypothetical protein NM688_g9150 [Phlebia brevispora]|uniref:Uncharacterized protein n=1 Tax=Phlebia brevispora TaxID=194682 RepID=A0ACC1RMF3_9APHY|nr:hypothetical protein NM688_g9150 [Phlebia brevispora]